MSDQLRNNVITVLLGAILTYSAWMTNEIYQLEERVAIQDYRIEHLSHDHNILLTN